ncbi:MAG: GNAT family N-acetyltransferase [Gammaproteobacteria bacterium]|nr:GNAT family N-acetyltransferase [Gammaproteobacteria bacterium]
MNRKLAAYHATETLPGGQVVHLRAIRPSDRERLREEFLKLSTESVRDRFFSVKLDLTPKELTYLTEVDFDHHVALVVELETGPCRIPVAVGRLVRKSDQPDHSEIAITVTDEMQGKGIGKVVLKRLLDCARELGIRHVDASVFADNTRMLTLIRKTGFPVESYLEDGIRNISVAL